MSDPQKPNLKQNTQINGWKLQKKLGEGGQGVVWKVGHIQKHSPPAALKLCTSLESKARERFKRESSFLLQCRDAGVIAVRDVGEYEEYPYFVMALAAFSAKDIFSGDNPAARLVGLSTELLLNIFRQACNGVAYLHERDILHRDIKPSNVLVMGADGQPFSACVADFGIAALEGQQGELTEMQEVVGTKIYRAPEVEIGTQATPASDVYSLGRTLEFLLTGIEPSALIPRSISQTESRTRALCDHLNEVLAKACAHDPRARYVNARELAAALPQLQVGVRGEQSEGSQRSHALAVLSSNEKVTIGGTCISSDLMQRAWSITVSWAEIMATIGPMILWRPMTERILLHELAKRFSGSAQSWLGAGESEKIKYRLEQLRLVEYKGILWSLTEEGRELVKTLIERELSNDAS